jgi:TetR/AcrR family fatty acid metabolism transcriptional regulator
LPSPRGKKTSTRVSEEERRRTILRAAVDVFAHKGYHGCRIADVAKEAKVAYGLVYHYFQDKDELLRSVFELAWGGFIQRVGEVAEGEGHLSDQISRICEVAFEAYRVDPRGVKVILLEVGRSPMGATVNRASVFSEVIRLAEGMFERAQKRGELRPELSPKMCAALLIGGLEMGLTTFVAGLMPSKDLKVLQLAREQLTDTLLRGVLSPEAHAERWGGHGEVKWRKTQTR